MFANGGLYSAREPPLALTLYCAQDKTQEFWRDPVSDELFGGLFGEASKALI